jgi:hypothetical protein
MTVLTGSDGELRYQGRKISKCRDWSVTFERPLIDTTCLSDYDRNYRPGIRSATGTATCLYQPSDKPLYELLNTIFEDDAKSATELMFVFNRKGTDLREWNETGYYLTNTNQFTDNRIRDLNRQMFTFNGYLTNINHPVSVGEAQAITINFQSCGPIQGRY